MVSVYGTDVNGNKIYAGEIVRNLENKNEYEIVEIMYVNGNEVAYLVRLDSDGWLVQKTHLLERVEGDES